MLDVFFRLVGDPKSQLAKELLNYLLLLTYSYISYGLFTPLRKCLINNVQMFYLNQSSQNYLILVVPILTSCITSLDTVSHITNTLTTTPQGG